MKLAYSKATLVLLPVILLQQRSLFISGTLCVRQPVINEDKTVSFVTTGSCATQNSGLPDIVDRLKRNVEKEANRDETTATEAQTVTITPVSEDARVRLVGGKSSNEGRVEVFHEGAWGTVCDDDFCMEVAFVFCRMLGYNFATAAPKWPHFGEGTGPIWLDNVSCTGAEGSLTECKHNGWGVHDCGHYEDASVVCANFTEAFFIASSTQLPDGSVRLVNGSTKNAGRVEVVMHGMWGTACDKQWGFGEADVVCRQLGYRRARVVMRGAYFGQGSGPVWLSSANCYGGEANITGCGRACYGDLDCDHTEDASVECE